MHRFNPGHAHVLDSEWRRRVFPPEDVVGFALSAGVRRRTAVDVGAGTGYLTVPLARAFQRVYAIEASPKMAEILKRRIEDEKLDNVEVVITERPPDIGDFDLVVFSSVLHEMENPREYLRWAGKAFVLVAEWKKEPMPFGPPIHERLSPEDVIRLAGSLEVVRYRELPYHYLMLLKPKT
ncbi:class I SAM-dependent methyltransferase [Thermococcus sp. M36]|uniref:class I SAM-dependent methyltransferase n=1 Tax=Thermococcus sp. M36 TaxID=1638261 RepID=UPI001439ECAC|nr:class I SAM-dependent methyltransferase [Thermococcus sp. M36]NJE04720.1 class I SAM-dependent methyltransferase [Thermococcus sp. M36]